MAQNPEYAELPDELLRKLNAFTYGGFILFFFDAKGEAHVEMSFPEQEDAIALKKFALDIMNSMDAVQRRNMEAQIEMMQQLDQLSKEDDGDDEEEE